MLAGLGGAAAWSALAACGAEEADEQPSESEETGLELLLDGPTTLDPALAAETHEFTILRALFEPLVAVGPDGVPTSAAAESWQVTDAGRAYTFKIRPNARWTNGEQLTADDFVWSWQRSLSPEVGGTFNYLMFPVRGAEAFALGETDAWESVQVTAPEPSTLRVRLEQPTPGFLARLAVATFYPVPRAEIEAAGSAWVHPANLRSNGPYQLSQWEPGSGLTLLRNQHYWGPPGTCASVAFRFAQAEPSRLSAFRSGLVDVTEVRGADYQAALADHQLHERLRLFERAGSWFVVLNTAKWPWSITQVRQALSLVLDRRRLAATVFDEPTLPAWSLTPPSVLGREALPQEPEVERARALLAEAGFADGQGFPAARLTYHRTSTWQRLAAELSLRWRETLGISVVPDEREWRDFLGFTDKPGDFDMYRGGWTAEYPDPANWYDDLWRSDRDYLRAHWRSAEFDAHLDAARDTADQRQRFESYAAADAVLEDGTPAIPIAHRAAAYLLQPTVTALGIDPVTGAIELPAVTVRRQGG